MSQAVGLYGWKAGDCATEETFVVRGTSPRRVRRTRVAKRALDLAVSLPALIASAPVQAGIAIAVARRLGRPVLFRQERPGLHGVPFQLVKFRTMLPADEESGRVSDAERMTPLGSWLRATITARPPGASSRWTERSRR